MVKRTLELYECDICGGEGERYTVTFPDGQMTLDRCQRHNSHIEKLRNEKGAWSARASNGRSSFRISTIEDIQKQRKQA